MRQAIFILIFILNLTDLFSQPSPQQKPRLAVLDFKVNDISPLEMKSIITSLSTLFTKTAKYTVLDISQRKKQLSEMEFANKDCTDLACQIRIGKLLAVQYIIIGDIIQISSRTMISLKLLEVQTSIIVGKITKTYNDINTLLDNLPFLVEKISGRKIIENYSDLNSLNPADWQKSNTESLSDKERKHFQVLIKNLWISIIEDKTASQQDIIKILTDFISTYPSHNPYLQKAHERLQLARLDYCKYKRLYSPYREGVEWISSGLFFSNYGYGGRLDLFTLKWRYFFWDIIKFCGGGDPILTDSLALKWSTQIGIPIWFNERTQLRLGTGPSWGYIYASGFDYESLSHFTWALEASLITHFKKQAAFQLGLTLDFPVTTEVITAYIPLYGIFIGSRF